MKNYNWILLAVLTFSITIASELKALEIKASGSVSYGGWLNDKDRQKAKSMAIRSAIKRWVSKKHPDQLDNYLFIQEDIQKNISKYLLGEPRVTNSQKKDGQYTVEVLVDIDTTMLERAFLKKSDLNTGGRKKLMTFVFVSREQAGTKTSTEKSDIMRKAETRGVGKDKGESQSSMTKEQERTVSKKSEVINRTPEALWKVSTANEIDAAMSKIFVRNKYRVAMAAAFQADSNDSFQIDDFVADYGTGNDIDPSTMAAAIKGLSSIEGKPLQFLALGTLDLGHPSVDPKTGNKRISVQITGKVIDVLSYGVLVASCGPVTYVGQGSDNMVARNNALVAAAEKCAKSMVAQMSSNDVR